MPGSTAGVVLPPGRLLPTQHLTYAYVPLPTCIIPANLMLLSPPTLWYHLVLSMLSSLPKLIISPNIIIISANPNLVIFSTFLYIYLSAVSRITQAARGSDEGRPNSLTSILQLSCLMHRNHRPYSNHVALQLAEYYVV